MKGWSPSVMTAASTSPSAATPACRDADWPVGPLLADDDVGAAEVDGLPDLGGVRAEHDHDRRDRRHREHRADGVLEQRPPVEAGDLLDAAEALALPRGEHDPADLRFGLSGHRRSGHSPGTYTRIRTGRPPAGPSVGVWRILSSKPGCNSTRKREPIAPAIVRISAWPKRIPRQIREPPPNGT